MQKSLAQIKKYENLPLKVLPINLPAEIQFSGERTATNFVAVPIFYKKYFDNI